MDNYVTHGFILDGMGGAKEVHRNREIKEVPPEHYCWMHLDASNPSVSEWLKSSLKLSQTLVDEMMSEESRPQFRYYEGGILFTLRSVNDDGFVDPEDLVSLHVWIEKRRIITISIEHIPLIEEIALEIEKGSGPVDGEDFLMHLIVKINKSIGDVVTKIEDKVDEIEDQILENTENEVKKSLLKVRRNLIVLRRYILPQRDMLLKMFTENLGGKYKVMIRDAADKLVRYIEDLDVSRDRAMLIQEELTNQLSTQMNRTIYIMTMISTIFLPLTFMTGLLGTNVGGIPGSGSQLGFYIVCGVAVSIAILEYLFFKRKRYL